MTCEKIKKMLPEYVVGGLGENTRTEVEAHMASCAECREELDLLEATGAMLEPVEMVEPPKDIWERVQERLAPHPVRVRPRVPAWRRVLKPVLTGLALVAIVLALVIGMPLLWQPAVAPTPVTDMPLYAEADAETYTETIVAAAWDQPLNDEASLALAMVMSDPEGTEETVQ